MNNAEFLGSARNPILLPAKNDFVQLIIKKVHASVKHYGLRDTLTTVRERFWILRGREAHQPSRNEHCIIYSNYFF